MAARHIALLRGVNVGKAKRIAMADLRKLVEDLGYLEVKTLLNSGNVVFTAPPRVSGNHAAHIEQTIEAKLGISTRVTVLSAGELDEIMKRNPLEHLATNHSRYLIAILADASLNERMKLLARQRWTPDALATGNRVAYMWCASGILQSKLVIAFNKAFKDDSTTRNWATLLKLRALASQP
ncbi:MAG: DUF1697 domain-containing protein [Candidatus Eisenbacteria bacterium]|uniref:DUF1697 domain-containing protein n=1 Tax=Eiseniibacteriota bacterium TaxID=2212470 RepID=A0A849SDE5_UNCEI|nr:DUF1697 domain-containing protein [Candidatus Eisenbacteria bacterium]